jgi:cytidylate kinase
MNIAIDGPAGAGKSTIAKLVAKKKGYIYVDTGAMYRAIAIYILDNNIDVNDIQAVEAGIKDISISIAYENDVQNVYLNNENVTGRLRQEAVGNMASKSSAIPYVREKLLSLQRNLAEANDVVMDGRDIGTNVLPNAETKIYLTASSKVRAKRRFDELVQKGETPDIKHIESDIILRDKQDMERAVAPLKKAEDAVLIDSSDMTIEEVVETIIKIAG